jgi:tetratricopeptide (TPR) repeat protein
MLAEREGQNHLRQMQALARQGDYDAVLRAGRGLLDRSLGAPPADAALFSMGLAYADRAYGGRDAKKALDCFTRLVNEFPDSPWQYEARVWIGVLEEEVSDERVGRNHLQRMQLLAQRGDFQGAIRENRLLLEEPSRTVPVDALLFSLGLLYADPANPEKDYRTSLEFFSRLVAEFPQSPFADDGRIWDGILENEVIGGEGRAHSHRMRELTRRGDFEEAVRENQMLLAAFPETPPGDAALFSLGQIYADHRNPRMDYRKALGFFSQLLNLFPRTTLAEGARIWVGVLERQIAAQDGRVLLQRVQSLIRRDDFDGAMRESQKVLALAPKGPPGDVALYSMGLISAHYGNPRKDYRKAHAFFVRLRKEFPASFFAEEARIWTSVLETMEKALLVDVEIDAKKKALGR